MMYKAWIKTIGLSLLVVSTALFLELEVEGGEYVTAMSFGPADYEQQIFDLKYTNFDLDNKENIQYLTKTRYVSGDIESADNLMNGLASLNYYPTLSETKVKKNSFFWDNHLGFRNPNSLKLYENYDDKEFEYFQYSAMRKSAEKESEEMVSVMTKKKDCTLTDVQMQDGESGVFYSQNTVPFGTSCDLYKQERTCGTGIISGDKSYKYTRCEAGKRKNCSMDGQIIPHGESVLFYKREGASFNETCSDLSQKRSCVNGTMTGDIAYDRLQCHSVMGDACFFSGHSIKSDQHALFYKSPLVPYGAECTPQFRACIEGKLSGNYKYANCAIEPPASCQLGLISMQHNEKKVFYKNGVVPYGSVCESEERSCDDGEISGNREYKESFCRVTDPMKCNVGDTVLTSGETKLFYLIPKEIPGEEVCKAKPRTCENGVISGNDLYTYESCVSHKKQSCTLDGVTVEDGIFVDFYKESTVASNGKCESVSRRCDNGTFEGDVNYKSSSCRRLKTCSIGDQKIKSNSARIFYKEYELSNEGECIAELRSCHDGTLSGDFNNFYCFVKTDLEGDGTCFFSGNQIQEGDFQTFYSKETVPYGKICEDYSRPKFCINGRVKPDTKYVYTTCEVEEKPLEVIENNCLFDGKEIKEGASELFYKNSKVQYGGVCEFERRVCRDGTLFGKFTKSSCRVEEQKSCSFQGEEIKDGQSQTFYSRSKSMKDDTCNAYKQRRFCINGVLSGDDLFNRNKCVNYERKSCLLDGVTVLDGMSSMFYTESRVNDSSDCNGQKRSCEDGVLSGDLEYKYSTCKALESCRFGNDTIAPGDTRIFYDNTNVFDSLSCHKQIRTCNDGTLSGSFNNQYCFAINQNSCHFAGVSIGENAYKTFYSLEKAPEGKRCEDYSRKKYCLTGKVEGEAQYIYSNCIEETK